MKLTQLIFVFLLVMSFSFGDITKSYNDTRLNPNVTIDQNYVSKRLKGKLQNQLPLIINIAKQHNICPVFFMALIALECGWGKYTVKPYNFGGMRGAKGYITYNNVSDGLTAIAKNLKNNYHNEGRISIYQIQKKYAPLYDNNSNWLPGIKSIMKSIKKTTQK